MKIAFHTLGCKVNQYESAAIAALFEKRGETIVSEKDYADVYIINTCTVTAIADRKSRQYIRKMKKINPECVIIVTGCYAQISPEEIAKIKDVDIITGTNQKKDLPIYLDEFLQNQRKQRHIKNYNELLCFDEIGETISHENRVRAFVKIQEGCNRFCSYCVIPYARGPIRSRSIENIVNEARILLEKGYKELVLTGINTALYDMENVDDSIEHNQIYGVEKVVKAINEIEGDFRIRLSSLEPTVVNVDYVKKLLKYDKLCHHLHLSAQSGSNSILNAMNRPYTREEYLDIIKSIRKIDPRYGFTTDIIVGFPGERELDFEYTKRLVVEAEFLKTHIFKFSKRPLTKAYNLEDDVVPPLKTRRSNDLHKVAYDTTLDFIKKNIGYIHEILIEEVDKATQLLTGYTRNYIKVYIQEPKGSKSKKIEVNTILEAKLVEPFEDGVLAEIK